MKWIKEDGYHEKHLYVDDSGRIHGEVGGSTYEPNSEWSASDRTVGSLIGYYISREQAKRAVEAHAAAKQKRRKARR